MAIEPLKYGENNYKADKIPTAEQSCLVENIFEDELKQINAEPICSSSSDVEIEEDGSISSIIGKFFKNIFSFFRNLFVKENKPIDNSEDKKHKANGEIDSGFSQGLLGDCVLLGTTYSLAQSEKGKEIIKNAIKINYDKNNEAQSYDIYFKGIDETFTITKEELQKAEELSKKRENGEEVDYTYSKGDDDVLLLELAWEKCYNQAQDKLEEIDVSVHNMQAKELNGPEALEGVNQEHFFYALTGEKLFRNKSMIISNIRKHQTEMEMPRILEIFNNQKTFKFEDVSFNNRDYKVNSDGQEFTFGPNNTYEIIKKPSESEDNTIIIKNVESDKTFTTDADFLARSFAGSALSEENKKDAFNVIFSNIQKSDVVAMNVSGSDMVIPIKTADGEESYLYTKHCYGVKSVNEEYIIAVDPHYTSEEIKIPKEELWKNFENIEFANKTFE